MPRGFLSMQLLLQMSKHITADKADTRKLRKAAFADKKWEKSNATLYGKTEKIML